MSFIDDLFNDPVAGSDAETVTDATGKILSAFSHYSFGQQAMASGNFQAAQLRQNAGQALAASQREAFNVDRQAQYVASSALAQAAGSGGGASDPTVVNLIARNAQEMAYRKSVALYGGEEKARLMNLQADTKQFEGENIAHNSTQVAAGGLLGAGSTILRGAERSKTLFDKFNTPADTSADVTWT